MKKHTTSILWFIAAAGFMISGILGKNSAFIILSFAFLVLGCQHWKTKGKD